MSLIQIAILLALTVYAIYRQSIRHEVVGHARFRLAAIYGVVGFVAGGFEIPPDVSSWIALAAGIVVSAAVGVARGRLTRLWIEPDGRIFSQGTAVTIALFLLVVGIKWILGAVQYIEHQPSGHGGFGEILVLIAVMIALQAEVIWRRARLLRPGPAPAAVGV